MSAFPPSTPPGAPAPMYQAPAPGASTTNVWAIVSLITGIVGCLFITPLVAIVTGFIGIAQAKPPKGGKGMAIAGIILGFLWIGIGIGSIFAAKAGVQWVQNTVAEATKQPTIALLNSLQDEGVDAVKGQTNAIGDDKLAALAEQLKPLGKCQDITVASPSYNNSNGVITFGFTGTAVFEKGSRTLNVEVRESNGKLIFDKLDVQ